MFVSRKRYDGLVARYDRLVRKNKQILAMVRNAQANLVPVFGQLESLGVDEYDTAMYFRAADGLANIVLYPASGQIIISDPRSKDEDALTVIGAVCVDLDEDGELDSRELAEIRRFRADVLFAQQNGGHVSGSVPAD